LRKRFYILFVARDEHGQLRKIPIPVHYLYIFVVGAAIGFLSLTGIASSYARMLLKVSSYNQLRTEKEDLKGRYSRLEQVAVGRLPDRQASARHHDFELGIGLPEMDQHRRHRGGARARGQRIAGASLPDFDPRPAPVYEDVLLEQERRAISDRGPGDIAKLLVSGDTWKIE